MSVTRHAFGKTRQGQVITLFRLTNTAGASAELLNYGCTLRSLKVPDRQGRLTDVVLGYDTITEYEENDGYFGAVVGRYANRIAGARFTLNGKTCDLYKNDGENTLHGGKRGFDKYIWDAMADGDRVVFSRCSPDGEEGYPGALYVKVTYALSEDNVLTISYEAGGDGDTVVNLTNHAYWNLNDGGTVLGHKLTVFSDRFCENGPGCLPTGRLLPVAGTPFDFTLPKPIGRDMEADCPQLAAVGGYDHNFVLCADRQERIAAVLYSEETGIRMQVSTTSPGNFIGERAGKNGARYARRDAVCLETQQYPDAPNQPAFPSPVLLRGEKFLHRTAYAFTID